ncbi:secretory lipase [Nocardia tenerifensis]|uniref:Secretory lipase n=1 Tax=Nocardia tenerifensis TaxID=228006 RepID=A0A318K543_9NOCA|nr:lipase family protein [Nocardia tenerifensis]PXX65128.1 secretory lipase [Nocardia tenerifensis]
MPLCRAIASLARMAAIPVCTALAFTAAPAAADIPDGRLLGIEALDPAWSFTSAATAIGFTYSTVDQRNSPALASAALYVPPGSPPEGGWPLVVWAHGATGIGDDCAPSRHRQTKRNSTYFNSVLDNGYAVLAPDYQGLGTPGPYSYGNSHVHARSVLDAVAAVRSAPVQLAREWVVIGQSGGARSALNAAILAAGPDGHTAGLSGVIATGLRTDPAKTLRKMFRLDSTGPGRHIAYAAYYLNSLEDLRPGSVSPYLSEFGARYVRDAATLCLHELITAGAGRRPAELVTDPDNPTPTFEADIHSLTGFHDGPIRVDAMIGYGSADNAVSPTGTPAYAATLQSRNPGVRVTLEEYAGKNHSAAFLASLPDALSFLEAHLR